MPVSLNATSLPCSLLAEFGFELRPCIPNLTLEVAPSLFQIYESPFQTYSRLIYSSMLARKTRQSWMTQAAFLGLTRFAEFRTTELRWSVMMIYKELLSDVIV